MIADVRWSLFTRLILGVLLLVVPLGGMACGGDDTEVANGATLKSIAISPATAKVTVGQTQQFAVTGTYSDNKPRAITKGITWTSSSTAVATISTAGLATAVAQGSTTITAKVGSLTATATMTVPGELALTSVQVTPASATIGIGTTQSFMATAMYNDGTSKDVTTSATWSSSDTAVATVAAGVASALVEGTATISALYEGETGSAILTVTGLEPVALTVAPGAATVAAGDTEQFTATLEYGDGSTQDVTSQATWSSDDDAVATVNADGLATGVAEGDTTISAAFLGLTGTADITVTPVVVTEVVIDPGMAVGVIGGGSVQFTATAIFSDMSSSDVTDTATWTSADATVASIDAAGLATPLAGGTTTITAEFGGVSGTATLTVDPGKFIQSIAVTPATASIAAGTTQQFIATATYSDNTTANVTSSVSWTTSAPATATVSALGLATGVATGTATITAALSSVQGTATLTVTSPPLVSIEVTPMSATVPAGGTQQYTATGVFGDNTTQDLTSLVSWTSSATGVATIDAAGLATTVALGTTTITATYQGMSGTAVLAVSSPPLTGVSVTCLLNTIAAGSTTQCTATATYADNTTQNVTSAATWTTSASAVATVSQLGLVSGATAGTADITAAYQGQSGQVAIQVTAAYLQTIQITPLAPSIALGNTQQFAAAGLYSDNSTQDITAQVTWTSATPAVAQISNAAGTNGLATSVIAGTTNITAALGGVTSNTAVLTVTGAVLTSIEVLPANPTVAAGFTQQFTVRGHYTDNSTADLTYDLAVSFSSGTTSVATISNAAGSKGLATTLAAGTTVITATRGTLTGTSTLTVSAITLSSIAVTPNTQTAQVGTTVQYTATGTFSDNSTMNITSQCTWAPTTGGVTVAAGGLATIAGTATPGDVNITATRGAVQGNATLTVVQPLTLTQVRVAWLFANQTLVFSDTVLPVGQTKQLYAIGTYSDGVTTTDQDISDTVTWASNSVNAPITNTAPRGRVTVNACTTPGQCNYMISATLGGLTGTRGVSTPNPLDCVEDEIVIYHPIPPFWSNAPTATMFKGQTQQWGLAAYFTDRPGRTCTLLMEYDLTNNPDVTWASDATGVATVTNTAIVSADDNPASPYTANLAARYVNGDGTIFTDSTLLTVSSACVQSLSISPADPTIPIGLQLPLSVTATLSDGSTQVYDYKNLTNELTFSKVPNSSAAFGLDQITGIVTAQATGTADVTVTVNSLPECDVNNPPEAMTTITVNNATITGVSVSPATLSTTLGAETQLTATGTYSDGSSHDVTLIAIWASNAVGVADFLSTTPGLLTALTQGNAVVTATVGTFSGSSAITVSGCTLSGITVDLASGFICGGVPAGAAYPVGVNVPLVATGSYVGGAAAGCPDADITNQVTWSSDLGTINVATNGHARTNGSTGGAYATITAASGGLSGTIQLSAETQTLANNLTVLPANFSIPNGGVAQFRASGSFASGACDLLGNVVTWGAAPSTLLTINATGRATGAATGAGNATVTATYAPDNTKTGTVSGTVGGDCIESLYITPTSSNLQVGGSVDFEARANLGSSGTIEVDDTLVTWTIEAQAPQGILTNGGSGVFNAQGVGTATIKGVWSSTTCSSPGTAVPLQVTAPITISAATLNSVVIECVYAGSNILSHAGNQNIPANVRGRCRAIGTASDGTNLGDISEDLDWTASGQASVSNVAGTKGAITGGVAAGSAIIRVEKTGSSPLIFDEQILTILPNANLASVALQPDPRTLPVGYGEQYSATGNYGAGLVFDVSNAVGAQWRCCTGTTATCTAAANCSVTGTGYITPTSGTPATVHPRIDFGGRTYHADLSISTQALSGITVNRLGTPQGTAANMVLGEQVQFQADGYFGTGGSMIGPFDITEDVNWSVSNAGYISVSNSAGTKGLADATAVTPGGTTVTILANNTTPAVQGTYAGLTVVNKCVDGITLNANTTSAPAGLGVRFTVSASYSDGSSGTITQQVTNWSSDNAAAFSMATNCGAATAGLPCVYYAGTPGQTSLITASFTGCGGATFTDSLLASVNSATLSSVDVSPVSTDLPKGQKTQFMATANYSNSTSFDVTGDPVYTTWNTTDPSVAAIVAGDPPGTVLASTSNFGSTSVIATYHSVSDFGTVNVVDEVLTGITVYALSTIPSGTTCPNFDDMGAWGAAPWISTGFQLPAGSYKSRVRAIGTYSDGSQRDITANVTWTSSVGGVATVVDGLVETGSTAGASTLTAALGGVSDTITLNTSGAAISAVNVVPNGGFTRPLGATARFHVIGTFGATSFCVDESATWTSANTGIATVSNLDNERGWTTGVALGGTNITATVGTYSDTEPFGVTAAVLEYIAVMPATVTIGFTETAQLVAMGHYSDGSDIDITTGVTTNWSTTPGTYGEVNNGTNKGLFTAYNIGAGVETVDACVSTICASTGSIDRSAEVTVSP